MKRSLFVLIAMLALCSCKESKGGNVEASIPSTQNDVIEILYFHGKQRCITCNAIEQLTNEVVEQEFTQEVKEGKIVVKVIDIASKAGQKVADKYEVTWSSLFFNKWKEGKEYKTNMTDFAFKHAKRSPQVFKEGIKNKIDELLK